MGRASPLWGGPTRCPFTGQSLDSHRFDEYRREPVPDAQSPGISHAEVQTERAPPPTVEAGTTTDRHGSMGVSVEVGVNAISVGIDACVGTPPTNMASSATQTAMSHTPQSRVADGQLGRGVVSSPSRSDASLWRPRMAAPLLPPPLVGSFGAVGSSTFVGAELRDTSETAAMLAFDRQCRGYRALVWREEVYEPPLVEPSTPPVRLSPQEEFFLAAEFSQP